MADPFATADASIFSGSPCADGTVTQGASSWTRRVLLSLDVETVDMNSGAVSRVNTVQFPRVGSLRPKLARVLIDSTSYLLESRISDDGYTETWRASA